tara:strand:+ start:2162 stop:2422 length:261 start_codon:yes stop_codon:yes gene_type:complete
MERDTIALIGNEQHLGSESRTDELAAHATSTIISILAALLGRDFLEHLCNGGSILCIKIGIDLVEEVERCWIALLDGKDEGESAQT